MTLLVAVGVECTSPVGRPQQLYGRENITDDEHSTRRTSEETLTPDAYCTYSIWRKNTNQNDLLVRIIDIIQQNQYLQCKLSTLTRIEQKLSVPLVLNYNRGMRNN